MNKKINVLSLFDGISCGRIALERAGIEVDKYYASEIDKYAIRVSENNYPDIIRLGSVVDVKASDLEEIDLIIAGPPCQDLSIAGKRKGLSGERSGLFWEVVRLIEECNPKYFLIENVASMPKDAKEVITDALGVEPILINSALVSAQNRKRLYWTNIPNVSNPEDKCILLKDIIEEKVDAKYFLSEKSKLHMQRNFGSKGKTMSLSDAKSSTLTAAMGTGGGNIPIVKGCAMRGRYNKDKIISQNVEARQDSKANCLTSVQKDSMVIVKEATKKGFVEIPKECGVDLTQPNSKTRRGRKMEFKSNCLTASPINYCWNDGVVLRKLTPVECERLQTLPDNYTDCVSNTQRYKSIGNGWTVDVIAHIFRRLK